MKSQQDTSLPSAYYLPKGWLMADTAFDWYREMRESNPVSYDPERRCWDVFLFDDVKRVLSDYECFSSQPHARNTLAKTMIAMDPPEHRLYRSLVTSAFTQRTIENMSSRISELVDDLISAVEGKSEMDAVQDFAFPLPLTVIAEILGVRSEDIEQFKHWSAEAIRAIDVENGETVEEFDARRANNFQELMQYFRETVVERRQNPQNDLISALLAAKVEGKSLSLTELLAFCNLLLIAGNQTTIHLIGSCMVTMAEMPDVQARVRADLSLLPNLIEEVLRMNAPIQALHRLCVKDTQIGGKTIRAGEMVLGWIGSANRDEAMFEQGDQFRLDRAQNKHIAFGLGTHICIGAPLTRLEARIALEAVLKRLPPFTLPPGVKVKPVAHAAIYGYDSIPLLF